MSGAPRLRELHVPGSPLVLPNAWDAWTARLVASAGFPAVASSSAAVARSLGSEDGEVMAHVVGFTGIEDNGQEGIELAAQSRLAGTPGSRKVIKDRKGRIVEDIESVRAPRDGEAVTLALDQRLQFLAHKEQRAAVDAAAEKALRTPVP